MKVIEVRFVVESGQYHKDGEVYTVDAEWLIETLAFDVEPTILGMVELQDNGFGHTLPTGYCKNFVEDDPQDGPTVTKLLEEGR